MLNTTQLITGPSNIVSSENLAEKTAVFGRKNKQNLTPLEYYPILASSYVACRYDYMYEIFFLHIYVFCSINTILVRLKGIFLVQDVVETVKV